MMFSLAYLGKGFIINLEGLPDDVLNAYWDEAQTRLKDDEDELDRLRT